ncbi:hypothetical protein fHeYen902_303c [Yersinia phage fHe-Yen9-02]|nr:hypothetical protein fHeYen902_303c [Yersinia phage fHe-Yen9-02]
MEAIDVVQKAADHLTWIQMVAFLCSWAGGVLVNYVNKTTREGLDWKEYWTRNPLTTIASLVVSFGICISMLLSDETNHLTYFSVAFMAENLINSKRPDDTQKKQRKAKIAKAPDVESDDKTVG